MSISMVEEGFRIGPFTVTNTMVWTWFIMIILIVLFTWLAKGAEINGTSKKQVIAEMLVNVMNNMTSSTMGARNIRFAPYFTAVIAFLGVANLSGFLFLGIVRPPTADWATTLGLALITFFLIEGWGIKTKGIKEYVKGFFEPFFLFLPMNIIGELATPLSLSFRLFGNIVGGLVIGTLIYKIFAGVNLVAGWTIIAGIILICVLKLNKIAELKKLSPGQRKIVTFIGVICFLPIFAISFVHAYFDLWAGCFQAFIFTMLSMSFITNNMADE